MNILGPLSLRTALFLAAFSLLACGGGSRQLQSLTITPVVAGSQVQFNAVGTFTGSSQPTPVSALWWTNPPWTYPLTGTAVAPYITVSSTGFAQCAAVAPPGAYVVWAVAPVDPSVPLSQMTGSTKQLTATAHLSCP